MKIFYIFMIYFTFWWKNS